MANLTEQQRVECWREMQRNLAGSTAGTKAQWRTMLDALDTFLEANAGAVNSAIPLPERATFTVKEKAFAMMLVIKHRYLAG